MVRSLRMTAATLAAVAIVGTTATAQADDIPTTQVIYLGASPTPSPKDIVLNWEGTCTNPGQQVEASFFGPMSGSGETQCSSDGTFRLRVLIYNYEGRGLEFGQSYDYSGILIEKPAFKASSFEGTATL